METACANSEGVATRATKASSTVPAKTIFLEFVFNMVTPQDPGTCRRQGGYKRGCQRRLYIRGLAASVFFRLFTSRRPGSAGMVRRITLAGSRGTMRDGDRLRSHQMKPDRKMLAAAIGPACRSGRSER